MRGLPSASILLVMAQLAAQAPTCRLEGQVVDPMRNPVRGAIVAAEHEGAVVARTSTDADGFFVFGKLPQDRVRLVATSRDPDIGALELDLLETTQQFTFLTVMPARVVTGTVTDSTGAVVAGAFVVAVPDADGLLGPVSCTTTSGADGTFRLGHVPCGRCLLRGFAPGHASFGTTIEGTGDLRTTIAFDETDVQTWSFPLSGAGAETVAVGLSLTGWHDGQYLPLPPNMRSRRGQIANWQADTLVDGDWLEAVLGADVATEPRRRIGVGGGLARVHPFELLDGDAAVLKLQFTNVPVRPTRVLLQELNDEPRPARRICTIAANGQVEVQAIVPPDTRFALRMLDPEFVVRGTQFPAWYVGLHRPGAVHTIDCVPAHALHVRIVDPAGQPCPGATLQAHGMSRALRGRVSVVLGNGQTRRDGTEELRGLQIDEQKRVWLTVRSPRGWFHDAVEIDSGANTDLDTLTLQTGGELLLLVRDASGQPVPGGRVQVRSGSSPTSHAADRAGNVLLSGLPPGPCRADVFAGTFQTPEVQIVAGKRGEQAVIVE